MRSQTEENNWKQDRMLILILIDGLLELLILALVLILILGQASTRLAYLLNSYLEIKSDYE